jgi:tRNA U34 5-methylaminomethyl-2-thiouridine-forming methyltransferase MnmC
MWTPVRTDDGSWTLRNERLAQACHSTSGAWEQARLRYAAPCRLRELARERSVVHLLDIGTGLGLNLAAALAALEGTQVRLHAVSFEADASVFAAARELTDWPADAAPHVERVQRSIAGHPDASLDLRLELGDARESIERVELAEFDAVFLDPFSPQVAPELWSEPFLLAVARRMAPHAVLSTYSAAFSVRLRLARAGLRVGRGPRVGRKSEGTLASARADLPPLEARLQRRIERRAATAP